MLTRVHELSFGLRAGCSSKPGSVCFPCHELGTMVKLNTIFCKGCDHTFKLEVDHHECSCREGCNIEELANVKEDWLTEAEAGGIQYFCPSCVATRNKEQKLKNKRIQQSQTKKSEFCTSFWNSCKTEVVKVQSKKHGGRVMEYHEILEKYDNSYYRQEMVAKHLKVKPVGWETGKDYNLTDSEDEATTGSSKSSHRREEAGHSRGYPAERSENRGGYSSGGYDGRGGGHSSGGRNYGGYGSSGQGNTGRNYQKDNTVSDYGRSTSGGDRGSSGRRNGSDGQDRRGEDPRTSSRDKEDKPVTTKQWHRNYEDDRQYGKPRERAEAGEKGGSRVSYRKEERNRSPSMDEVARQISTIQTMMYEVKAEQKRTAERMDRKIDQAETRMQRMFDNGPEPKRLRGEVDELRAHLSNLRDMVKLDLDMDSRGSCEPTVWEKLTHMEGSLNRVVTLVAALKEPTAEKLEMCKAWESVKSEPVGGAELQQLKQNSQDDNDGTNNALPVDSAMCPCNGDSTSEATDLEVAGAAAQLEEGPPQQGGEASMETGGDPPEVSGYGAVVQSEIPFPAGA